MLLSALQEKVSWFSSLCERRTVNRDGTLRPPVALPYYLSQIGLFFFPNYIYLIKSSCAGLINTPDCTWLARAYAGPGTNRVLWRVH